MTAGLLVTADGFTARGVSVGAEGVVTGEVVFNTAMSGYQEVVTDPSYAGQIVIMTAPHIGNYGVAAADAQGSPHHCAGMVMRSMSPRHSSWRSEGAFDDYLRASGIVALSEVDTRRLTRHVRERGAVPAAIGVDADEGDLVDLATSAPSMVGRDLVREVTTSEPYAVEPGSVPVGSVIVLDYGVKRDIVGNLAQRGLSVTVVPADTSAAEILAMEPDGVLLSNGPGDPEPLRGQVAAVRELLGVMPIFGICLGHQILGLALGARTEKLPFGHHGANHPVRNLADGTVAITSQNHGFSVDLWSLASADPPHRSGRPDPGWLPGPVPSRFGEILPTHQNLNDGTLEGLACPQVGAVGVQFHPEAAPGPRESTRLFDDFLATIGAGRAQAG